MPPQVPTGNHKTGCIQSDPRKATSRPNNTRQTCACGPRGPQEHPHRHRCSPRPSRKTRKSGHSRRTHRDSSASSKVAPTATLHGSDTCDMAAPRTQLIHHLMKRHDVRTLPPEALAPFEIEQCAWKCGKLFTSPIWKAKHEKTHTTDMRRAPIALDKG